MTKAPAITAYTPSRRTMIGALAALPVASAPILAGAAAMNGLDPIFELIEAWKRANAEADKAYENYKPLYDAVGPWPGVTVEMSFGLVGEKPTAYNAVIRSDLVRWLDNIDPRHADKIREQIAQILEREPVGLSSAERRAQYDAERSSALAQFDEARGTYDTHREASGLNAAAALQDELCEAQCNAKNAVLAAQPRTQAGAIALIMFAAEDWANDGDCENSWIVAAMVNAARAIADDPSKVVISERLAEALAS